MSLESIHILLTLRANKWNKHCNVVIVIVIKIESYEKKISYSIDNKTVKRNLDRKR